MVIFFVFKVIFQVFTAFPPRGMFSNLYTTQRYNISIAVHGYFARNFQTSYRSVAVVAVLQF